LQNAFKNLAYKPSDMPNSELASQQVLSLPVYPELSDAQQDQVVKGIEAFYGAQG
jgi:dTDP-4-amino-4,6-dideoxygalactose transaminase